MAPADEDALQKLRSKALRAKVDEADPIPSVVIVEIADKFAGQIVVARDSDGLAKARAQLLEAGEDDPAASLAALAKQVAEITGRPPLTMMPTSGAIVIEADGREIGRIAALPAVQAIWPNDHS